MFDEISTLTKMISFHFACLSPAKRTLLAFLLKLKRFYLSSHPTKLNFMAMPDFTFVDQIKAGSHVANTIGDEYFMGKFIFLG